MIAADGRIAPRVPIVVADHRRAVVVEPGRTASVWLKLLAPEGIVAPGARQLLVRLHGVRGPLALRASRADLSEHQLVVSYVTSGSVSRLPGSTGLPPRCRRLGVVTVRDQLGGGAGHFDEGSSCVTSNGDPAASAASRDSA